MEIFNVYLKELKKFPLADITEHTHRKHLQDLLESISHEINKKIKILHEPKRLNKFGAPDFKIIINESIIGYVENKKIEENLDEIIKTEQIKKYRELSKNILLTNYIDWIWIKDKNITRETLCYKTDIESRNFKPDEEKIAKVSNLIHNFFSQPPIGISKPKELAFALAVRGKLLKEFLQEELLRQEKEHLSGKLFGLYDTFKNNIHNELSLTEFADAFSQTLIYGLFLAKLNLANSNSVDPITLNNAKNFIPVSFELIKELLDFIDVLDREEYKEVKWIVEEVLSIMNNLELSQIQSSLSYKKWNRKFNKDEDIILQKDPYVYFYEDFLSAYDKKLRKAKGVYYTPPPVVNFIVRAIDDILVDKFCIKDGLADRGKVTVLDFATGTGTFLLEIFKNIFEKLPPKSGKLELIIKEHILKNLYGFEFLIAPYTIAHLKLSQFLIDNGFSFDKKERLQVYLTNTLEPLTPQHNAFIPALSEESKLAKEVKEKPILVITGNPPYSGHSQNPSWRIEKSIKQNKEYSKKILTWIGSQIENYKFVDGKPLGEKNPKWLQDDYVKFIRFAQFKMEQVDEGIVGIITNHSFLDNPTFRGMRQSLMNTFDEMYFLDLHGNAKKKEKTPDGDKDENVFDIEQGVCISIMIKTPQVIISAKAGIQNKCKIFHSNFYGLREEKYNKCLNLSINDIEWKKVKPETPFYLFLYRSNKNQEKYNESISILDIFELYSTGFYTGNDDLLIDYEYNDLINKLTKNEININDDELLMCDYRPFDKRYIYYNDKHMKRRRYNFMSNIINKDNIIINTCRNPQSQGIFRDVLISNIITDLHYCTGGNYCFPLFIKSNDSNTLFNSSQQHQFQENFKSKFRNIIDLKYNHHFTPEEILGYIYAVLHSPLFREKYSEFLKTDFPRIPFTDDINMFQKLSSLGWELIQIHLMNKEFLNKLPGYNFGSYTGTGDNEVKKVEYVFDSKIKKHRIKINPEQYFEDIPKEIYNFYIGGYQVIDKYLKARKGRTLTLDEIENVENIIKIIFFTINQMKKINALTQDWI